VFRSSLSHIPCHPRFRPVHNLWFLNAKLLYQLVEPWPIIALTLASLVELSPQYSYHLKVEQVQACLHRLPATGRPDPYQDWTFTSEQTMTFQDTPHFVGRLSKFTGNHFLDCDKNHSYSSDSAYFSTGINTSDSTVS
jgi:hypothetical protein